MVIYEVNLKLDAGIATDFVSWLGKHIGQLLALPGFREAVWLEREDDGDPASAADVSLWTIRYLLDDRRDLETYLREHADRMRSEALERFGGRFEASRRILRVRNRLQRIGG